MVQVTAIPSPCISDIFSQHNKIRGITCRAAFAYYIRIKVLMQLLNKFYPPYHKLHKKMLSHLYQIAQHMLFMNCSHYAFTKSNTPPTNGQGCWIVFIKSPSVDSLPTKAENLSVFNSEFSFS